MQKEFKKRLNNNFISYLCNRKHINYVYFMLIVAKEELSK